MPAPTVFAALGDDTRWAILQHLALRPASATQLAGDLTISRQAVAKHLGVLKSGGLVRSERRGREVVFSPSGGTLSDVAAELERIAHGWDRRLAELKSRAEQGVHAEQGADAEHGADAEQED